MNRKILCIGLLMIFILSGCNSRYKAQKDVQLPIIEPYTAELQEDIKLYYADKDLKKLVVEKKVLKGAVYSTQNVIEKDLFTEPKTDSYVNIIPSNIKILSIIEKDSFIYINLSKNIDSLDVDEKKEALILYSLVNTATSYSKNNYVQFLIEGQRRKKFIKYYSIDEPLEKSDLILYDYQSPIGLIRTYLNSITKRDFLHATRMRYKYFSSDVKENELVFELESQFENISKFNIVSYYIDKYDDKMNLYMSVELFDNKYNKLEKYNYRVSIVKYKKRFLIDEMIKY